MRIFAFADAQKADFPVRTLCRVCKVSASGFYAYAARLAACGVPEVRVPVSCGDNQCQL